MKCIVFSLDEYSESLIDNCSAKLPSIKPIVKDIDGEYR